MLPEQGPEIPVSDSHPWDARRHRAFGRGDLCRGLQNALSRWWSIARQDRSPELRLAQMVMEVGLGVDGSWNADPMLLERLEGQIAATDDLAVRKVLVAYLSEP